MKPMYSTKLNGWSSDEKWFCRSLKVLIYMGSFSSNSCPPFKLDKIVSCTPSFKSKFCKTLRIFMTFYLLRYFWSSRLACSLVSSEMLAVSSAFYCKRRSSYEACAPLPGRRPMLGWLIIMLGYGRCDLLFIEYTLIMGFSPSSTSEGM